MTRWLSGVAIAMSALTPIAATATPPSDAQTVTTRPAHILTSAARHETFLDAMVRSASADRDEAPEPVDVAAAIDAATDVLDRAWELPEVAPPALRSMRWPVSSSRLVAGFGPRSRAGGTRDRHTGMSFRAADTSVVAAADGVVAEVSTVPGLGIVVVVAHGGGILSVYGGMTSTTQAAGRRVAAGDVLGRGGVETTWRTREVYFEVRVDGVPQDPAAWLGR